MNRSYVISGIAIATIALVLVTTTMSDQQYAFAHRNYYHYGHQNHHNGSDGAAGSSGSSWR